MVKISGAYGKLKTWVKTQIAAHKAIADAHHAKYTDAEAVGAINTADKYIKNDAEDIGYVDIAVNQPNGINTNRKGLKVTRGVGYCVIGNGTNATNKFFPFFCGKPDGNYPGLRMRGLEVPGGGSHECMGLQAANATDNGPVGNAIKAVQINNWATILAFWTGDGTFDMVNHKIKDMKNHAATALSGTKKLVEIDIGGVPYYFEVYPTKT